MRINETKIKWNKAQIAILATSSALLLVIAVTDLLYDRRVGGLVILLIVIVQAFGLCLFRDKENSESHRREGKVAIAAEVRGKK